MHASLKIKKFFLPKIKIKITDKLQKSQTLKKKVKHLELIRKNEITLLKLVGLDNIMNVVLSGNVIFCK